MEVKRLQNKISKPAVKLSTNANPSNQTPTSAYKKPVPTMNKSFSTVELRRSGSKSIDRTKMNDFS